MPEPATGTAEALPTQTNPPTFTPEATPSPTPTQVPDVDIFPDADTLTWVLIASGFNTPTAITSTQDGSGRLYVLEKNGLVRVLKDGEVLADPFLDLRDRVRTQGYTTAGLLGMAFHPQYIENGFFFVNYTASDGDTVIARFQSLPDYSRGDPDSQVILLEITQPVGEHRGGDLAFGPDGYLYASIGDGGAAGYGDQDGNAQNPDSLLGKVLRLDVDAEQPYAIPTDNPYATEGGAPEVWVRGLRNPWRFSFDSLTGDLFIADVGEISIEEVNFLPAGHSGGENMGWNYLEGSNHFTGTPDGSVEFVHPVWEYDHTQGCSITGGFVYRGSELPELSGIYIYGDYCQGNVWGLLQKSDGQWENQLISKIPVFITSFGLDESGEIYLTDVTGSIYKLVKAAATNN